MNLREVCKTLEVSRSGYHAHQHKAEGNRRVQDVTLALEVQKAFHSSRCTYGSPRIMQIMRRKGIRSGKNRIARLMCAQGLKVHQKRRFVPRTTVADKDSPIAPNHLLERPAPQRLNEVWLTDITYLPTSEGWLYLAVEMDQCSRRILGWSTHASLATLLPTQALERALQARDTSLANLIHHSDRGCQYTSTKFRNHLKLRGITQSMSRKANCYDNATMESFWATLKAECFNNIVPPTHAKATSMIFDYIETFYNPVRLHSALAYQSPVEFEQTIQIIQNN